MLRCIALHASDTDALFKAVKQLSARLTLKKYVVYACLSPELFQQMLCLYDLLISIKSLTQTLLMSPYLLLCLHVWLCSLCLTETVQLGPLFHTSVGV